MYQVKTIDKFELSDFAHDLLQISDTDAPNALLVRSSQVDDALINDQLLAITRAGIGTNTINVNACTENGTVVLNTPGANANAVKELIIQALFRCVRPIDRAIATVKDLTTDRELTSKCWPRRRARNLSAANYTGRRLGF
ncbi:hypothetical protein QPX96_00935 [Limosilactobacillus fermentum]|nr:hypothetical protein [Limosilactobacillus fermentum]